MGEGAGRGREGEAGGRCIVKGAQMAEEPFDVTWGMDAWVRILPYLIGIY